MRSAHSAGTPKALVAIAVVGALAAFLGSFRWLAAAQDVPRVVALPADPRSAARAPSAEPHGGSAALPDHRALAVRVEVPAEPPPRTAQGTDPVPASEQPHAEGAARASMAAERAEQRERIRDLMCGEPAEQLARARAVLLGGETGQLAERALNILIELDPDAAVAELHGLASTTGATQRELSTTGSMIERLSRSDGVVTDTDLVAFFDSGSNDVRLAAASALEARGDGSLVHTLLAEHVETLAGDDEPRRLEAARQVSTMQSPTATPAVVSLLSDENEEARLLAIQSLARNPRDVDVIAHLKPLREDSSERIRRDASRVSKAMERLERARAERDRVAAVE